jgi:replicative DNA helicase
MIRGFMPRDGYRKINIFIAAPKDVATEKARIVSIVEQLNHGLADELGIVLEVKEWSQVVPNMGRGQQVIFDQLPVEQWDILIGILWLRYGTPSGGLAPEHSGTHEEFNIAYECWQKTGKPRIIFYRCTRPPEDLTKIDTDSLTKINTFFKHFETGGESQGLYSTYDAINDFEGLVRNHLEKILLEFNGQENNNATLGNDDHQQKAPQHIVNVLSDFYDQVDDGSKRSSMIYGVPTGFTDLDRLTNGLQPSSFLVVASQSSQSKTSFLLSIARNAALTYKKHIAIFLSLGMSNNKMITHFIAQETGIDSQRLSVGKLTEKEWPLFTHAVEIMAEAHIILDDTPALTLKQLKEKSYRLAADNKLDLIMVDNLQFVRSGWSNTKSDAKLNYLDLKVLAHELNVPILAGLHLPRNSIRRNDKRPILSDLHEFGSLEDIADVIMFIYHPDMYDRETAKRNVAEIIVAKHSFGYVGTIELLFREELFKFENAATLKLK